MNDISILMTGVLTTGQSSLPNSSLPNVVKEPSVQLDNQNVDYLQDRLLQQYLVAQVTPPEFAKPPIFRASRTTWNLAFKQDSILKMVREKVHSHHFSQRFGLRVGRKKIQQQVMDASHQKSIKSQDLTPIPVLPKITERPSFLEQLPLISLVTINTQKLPPIPIKKKNFDSNISHLQKTPQKTLIADGINSSPPIQVATATRQGLPILRFGHSGMSVRVLQKLLLSNGYAVRVDGFFGALTEAAVKGFQDTRRLTVDGIVGGNTWGALSQ
ncbi:MAG: peptidoglycan-binding domain-containing protein [Cyanobacteria bacterium P01_A01_bin.84]